MANDIYLKIDGIEGECNHKGAEKHIQLLGWNCGVSNASSAGMGGGSGLGKAEPHAFEFTHVYDKAAPALLKHCAAGKHIPNVKLVVCKAGDKQNEHLIITMKSAFVTEVRHEHDAQGHIIGTVRMSYEDVEHEYKAQDKDGAPTGGIKCGWNITTTETR